MINRLLPDEELRVGALSERAWPPHHNDSRSIERPNGGFIIDSPVFESSDCNTLIPRYGPGFIEFKPFLDNCRFRDCSHLVEKDCGVLAALENNEIRTERYQSFVNIVRDIDSQSH